MIRRKNNKLFLGRKILYEKSVAIINDDLGTMALGFSKAGYDISAIFVDSLDKRNYDVIRENWGSIVKEDVSEELLCKELS